MCTHRTYGYDIATSGEHVDYWRFTCRDCELQGVGSTAQEAKEDFDWKREEN